MGPRSMIIIFVIGILGLASLGMITKYVFDTDKGLQEAARFKVAFLETFGPRGIEQISYRKMREPRGVTLRIVADPTRISEEDRVHEEIAQFYLERFPQATHALKLVYLPKSRWGCRGRSPFADKELSLREVRNAIRARQKRERLISAVKAQEALELSAVEERPRELLARFAWAKERGGERDAEKLLAAAATAVVSAYRPPRSVRIHVVFVPAAKEPSADRADAAASETPPVTGGPEANSAEVPGSDTRGGRGHAEKAPSPEARSVLAEGFFDFRGRRIPARR